MKKMYSDITGQSSVRVIIFLFLFLASVVIANLYISHNLGSNESLPPPAITVPAAGPAESVRPPLPEFQTDEPSTASPAAPSRNREPMPVMKDVVREAPLSDVILAQ